VKGAKELGTIDSMPGTFGAAANFSNRTGGRHSVARCKKICKNK
jgi:hypothetical protein